LPHLFFATPEAKDVSLPSLFKQNNFGRCFFCAADFWPLGIWKASATNKQTHAAHMCGVADAHMQLVGGAGKSPELSLMSCFEFRVEDKVVVTELLNRGKVRELIHTSLQFKKIPKITWHHIVYIYICINIHPKSDIPIPFIFLSFVANF
jgi:hypothetical protein